MSVWYVALETGQVQIFQVNGKGVDEKTSDGSSLPPGMPPALAVRNGDVGLLPIMPDASPVTNPIQLPDGTMVYVDDSGNLVVDRLEQFEKLALDVLPDARILVDEAGRVLFLSGPSSSYSRITVFGSYFLLSCYFGKSVT
jgi:hypothetical protein